METSNIAAIGYSISAALFLILTFLLLSRWRDRPQSHVLSLASLSSLFWAGTIAAESAGVFQIAFLVPAFEWLRYISWLAALVFVLRGLDRSEQSEKLALRYGGSVVVFVFVAAMVLQAFSKPEFENSVFVSGGLALSILLLVLVEQIYRNSRTDSRSGIGYFSLAIGGMFAYDLALHALTLIDSEVLAAGWHARGYANAILILPLAYSVQRSFHLSLDTLLPRQIFFYTFAVGSIGAFFLLLVAGDLFIQSFGATWTDVARIVFIVSGLTLLGSLLLSASFRARTRVFLQKLLFLYKYDYRREWLRFIGTLSSSGPEPVHATAIKAVAQIVNSPGGFVWARQQDEKDYVPVGSWRCDVPIPAAISRESSLIQFLEDRQWIIDLNEMSEHPARYDDLQLDTLFADQEEWWLIVPMLLGKRLFGFIILLKPEDVPNLNFEDHDLLKTVGRHVATHIDQAESDRRLTESSQFGAYNRLTAFLMHDLNNLIAQQSLVVKNAERFRGDPKFVDDSINTIAHSVSRMRRLMEQLKSASTVPVQRPTNVLTVLKRIQGRTADRNPAPSLSDCNSELVVQADPERLAMVLEHLIRNAQDATTDDGDIAVHATREGGDVVIVIADSGCGMTSEFIRERLFRPFDSTKGSQSMGIGAHQARDYARSLGGRLDVSSEPGQGTTFRFILPLSNT